VMTSREWLFDWSKFWVIGVPSSIKCSPCLFSSNLKCACWWVFPTNELELSYMLVGWGTTGLGLMVRTHGIAPCSRWVKTAQVGGELPKKSNPIRFFKKHIRL
jgi:hypothetical protein